MSYQGDPKLYLDEDGAEIRFTGGQPEMEQGLENAAFILLFTDEGWPGSRYLPRPIGSSFNKSARGPITRGSLNATRDAAVKAVSSIGAASVDISNPSGARIDVTILLEQLGGEAVSLTRLGQNWAAQRAKGA